MLIFGFIWVLAFEPYCIGGRINDILLFIF